MGDSYKYEKVVSVEINEKFEYIRCIDRTNDYSIIFDLMTKFKV